MHLVLSRVFSCNLSNRFNSKIANIIKDNALRGELLMDQFLIFGATMLPVIVLFVLFNLVPKIKEKDYMNIKIGRLVLRIKFGPSVCARFVLSVKFGGG